MNNNNAPFYVGQRVVALKTTQCKSFVKGVDYGVIDQQQCKCGVWYVYLIECPINVNYFDCWCADCGKTMPRKPSYKGGHAKYFAPIDERTIPIPESLKEQAEEMIQVQETIKQPEKELA